MRGIRAWAFCNSFPETLDILYESLKDNSYETLIEKYDRFLDYTLLVPKGTQAGPISRS